MCLYISTPFSLRQMEQNVTDLTKIGEETKEKVSAVNSQKVTIVKAFIASLKVNNWCSIGFFTFSAVCPSSFSHFICETPPRFCLQLKTTLTMEKVYLSLEMVGLSAEKTKLEQDFREGASLLRSMDVRAAKAEHRAASCGGATLTSACSRSKGAANWSRGRSSWRNKAKARWREQSPSATCNPTILYLKSSVMLVLMLFCVICVSRRHSCRRLFSWWAQAFAKLPDTPDDIDSMLNEERSRAECFTGLSENVRRRWGSLLILLRCCWTLSVSQQSRWCTPACAVIDRETSVHFSGGRWIQQEWSGDQRVGEWTGWKDKGSRSVPQEHIRGTHF